MKKVSKTEHLTHGTILRFLQSGKPYRTLPEELGISYRTFREYCLANYSIAGDRKRLTRLIKMRHLAETRAIEMKYLHNCL